MKREFAGDVVRTELRATGEVFLDPEVLPDFALKNFLRFLHALTREVFAFGDDADADDVVVQRDVPEPAFLRHERHGRRAGVDAFIALRAFGVRPDSDLVQFGVADAPIVPHGGKRLATGTIQCDGRAIFRDFPARVLRPNAYDASAFFHEFLDGRFFFHRRAFFAGVIEQHYVEFGAQHLPGLSDGVAVVSGEKVERLRRLARGR